MRFVIHAPPLTKSAGVRALYTLGNRLRERGHLVGTMQPGVTALADAIHILWELGEAPAVDKVARWVLSDRYTPAVWRADELTVSWDPSYLPAPRLRVDLIERDWFYPKTTDGAGTLLWVYKGERNTPPVPDWQEVTWEWPQTRAELGEVLRGASVLYSCDSQSTLNVEATVCGTPVVFSVKAASGIKGARPWGMTDHWAGLKEAREECFTAAGRYEQYRQEIAGDVDAFVALCAERWG